MKDRETKGGEATQAGAHGHRPSPLTRTEEGSAGVLRDGIIGPDGRECERRRLAGLGRRAPDRVRKPPPGRDPEPHWHLPKTTVSSEFRERVLRRVPEGASDDALRALVGHLTVGTARDRDSGRPILAAGLLAEMEGKRAQYRSRNYSAAPFLERAAGVLPGLAWSDPVWSPDGTGRCRAATATGLEDLDDAVSAETAVPFAEIDAPVDFVTGQAVAARAVRAARELDRSDAEAASGAVRSAGLLVRPETESLCGHLNGLPSNLFTRLGRQNGGAALDAALAIVDARRRQHALCVLRGAAFQPQPYYRASARTARAVSVGATGLALPREVRSVFFEGWLGLDLRSAQLAYAAAAWPVPYARRFLEAGRDVWGELVKAGWGDGAPDEETFKARKGLSKSFLYALVFGMTVSNLRRGRCWDACAEGLSPDGAEPLAARLLAHPLVDALLTARRDRLGAIQRDGGAVDCFGHWVPSQRRAGARSALAQLAQAGELQMMRPLLLLAQEEASRAAGLGRSPDWRIAAWLHDGAWINCSNRTKADRIVTAIRERVNADIERMGYPTTLDPM